MNDGHPLIGIPAAGYSDPEYATTPMNRFNANYPAALAACGALPIVIPLGLPEHLLAAIYGRLDGLCLAGGVDVDPAAYGEAPHPHLGTVDRLRDETELVLARWALRDDLPLLAVCRGIQLLNVAAGGTLWQHIPAQLPDAVRHDYRLAEQPWDRATHRVTVGPSGLLARLLGEGEIRTNSFHHQGLKQVADGFEATAWAEDGLVEAIEHPALRFALGVQWHPEGMFRSDAPSQRIFEGFAAACRNGAVGAP